MIVVADSGPLHYLRLILLEHIELVRRFYGQALVPEPVASELSAAGAPTVVREWITTPPTWVDVRPVPSDDVSMITGTLGVLRSGAEQGLVNVPDLLERLKATSFYLDEGS